MVMGRNGYGPKWSWAEMVMGRNDPESFKTLGVPLDLPTLCHGVRPKFKAPLGHTLLYWQYSSVCLKRALYFGLSWSGVHELPRLLCKL